METSSGNDEEKNPAARATTAAAATLNNVAGDVQYALQIAGREGDPATQWKEWILLSSYLSSS